MTRFFSNYWLLCLFLIISAILGYNIYKRVVQKDLDVNSEALEEGSWTVVANKAVEKYVGKPLILPYTDSLYVTEVDYQNIFKLPLKVVNFLDGDCSTCLMKISYWRELVNELKSQGYQDIPVIMYAFSSLEENMRNYMNVEWTDQYPWQFDKKKSFIVDNELYDLRLQTVLLDADNNVILIGDPLLNPTLRKLYVDTIKSLL